MPPTKKNSTRRYRSARHDVFHQIRGAVKRQKEERQVDRAHFEGAMAAYQANPGPQLRKTAEIKNAGDGRTRVTDQFLEDVAQAIYETHWRSPAPTWANASAEVKVYVRAQARSAIAVFEARQLPANASLTK